MRNFSYNVANQSVFEGYRVIALKNVDMDKLANAANMKEPEIAPTPETVVEPQQVVPEVAQTVPAQNIPGAESMSSGSMNAVVSDAPAASYGEPVASMGQETSSINSQDINIPKPVVAPQTVVQEPVVNSQPESVVDNGNIFDAPVVRENVQSEPVLQESNVSNIPAPANEGVDMDDFMIKSQEIYDRTKSVVEEALVKAQKEQMNLVMQMVRNLEQLKVDNAAYSNAIDQVVNDESFKKVA